MNIFFVHNNPIIAAIMLCNKHVVKMILESVYMLYYAHVVLDDVECPYGLSKSHKNHPCTKWTRYSVETYLWLAKHAYILSKEYTRRYGKIHTRHDDTIWLIKNIPRNFANNGWITPSICMVDECKISNDPVECYREYYIVKKNYFAVWKTRLPPSWYIDAIIKRKITSAKILYVSPWKYMVK